MKTPRGKIELSNLVGLVVVAGVIWAGILFAQPVLDNLDVKTVISEAVNQRAKSEGQLQQFVISRVNAAPGNPTPIGTHYEESETGELIEQPGLELTEDNVIVDRDPNAETQTVTVDYTRTVMLKPLKKTVTLHFSPSKTGAIR